MMHQFCNKFVLGVFTVCFIVSACGPSLEERKREAVYFRTIGEGYLGEDNVSSALSELLKAVKLDPEDPYTHYDLGLAYFAKEKYEKAIVHFEKAIVLKPDYPEAFNATGTVYLRQEKWDDAIPYFEKALNNLLYASPDYALFNMAEAYRGKNDYKQALRFYEKALHENPKFVRAYQGMGLTYMEMGDYGAAVSVLEKAVRTAPKFVNAYFNLGLAYAGIYEREKATDAFRKVIALQPNSEIEDLALDEIEKLGYSR